MPRAEHGTGPPCSRGTHHFAGPFPICGGATTTYGPTGSTPGGPELAGGNGANFSQLIQLIQTTTSGPWFDVDGTGGQMSPYNTGVFVNPLGVMALLSKPEQTARLRDLCAHGLAERVVEPGPPTSVRYVATRAGRDARRLLKSIQSYARRHPELF